MGKNRPFAVVGIVCQAKTLFESAFRVSADQVRKASDNKFAKLSFPLRETGSLLGDKQTFEREV